MRVCRLASRFRLRNLIRFEIILLLLVGGYTAKLITNLLCALTSSQDRKPRRVGGVCGCASPSLRRRRLSAMVIGRMLMRGSRGGVHDPAAAAKALVITALFYVAMQHFDPGQHRANESAGLGSDRGGARSGCAFCRGRRARYKPARKLSDPLAQAHLRQRAQNQKGNSPRRANLAAWHW